MSTNKTEHLQLHRWESTDPFSREEINENFAAVDMGVCTAEAKAADELSAYKTENDAVVSALAARIPKVATGSYVGTGSVTAPLKINIGFAPQAVLVWANLSNTSVNYDPDYGGMAIRGHSLGGLLTVTDTGFSVVTVKSGTVTVYPHMNVENYVYFYLAIG